MKPHVLAEVRRARRQMYLGVFAIVVFAGSSITLAAMALQ